MLKGKKFMFRSMVLLLMAFLLIGTLTAMAVGESQEHSEFVTVEIYNPLTGETDSVRLHRVEAEGLPKAPRSSLENAVAVMGQELKFESEMQRLRFVNNEMMWMSRLVEFPSDLLYPDGPVISWGVTWDGYFIVALLEGLKSDKSVIDRVHAAFEDQFSRAGLRDAPVVFRYEGFLKEHARDARHRPVFGGLQVTRDDGGASTLGYAAVREGVKGHVVSGHAFRNVDMAVHQPNRHWLFPWWNRVGFVSVVGGFWADASFVPYDDVTNQIYITSTFRRNITAFADPVVGLTVWKSGITTDITQGVVVERRSTIGSPTFGTLYDQWLANYSSAGGDSGSPVYTTWGTSDAIIRGIHVGQLGDYAVFSPESGVWRDVGATPLGPSGVKGLVGNAETGWPLVGAKVEVHETGGHRSTNYGGYYEILVPPGSYTVTASYPLFYDKTYTVQVVHDNFTSQNFMLEPMFPGYPIPLDVPRDGLAEE